MHMIIIYLSQEGVMIEPEAVAEDVVKITQYILFLAMNPPHPPWKWNFSWRT